MNRRSQAALLLLAGALWTQSVRGEPPGSVRTWNFDSDRAGSLPAGFAAEKGASGKPGRWTVQAETGAPSGAQVLAQTDTDNSADRFLMVVTDSPRLRDLVLSVRCKAISGKTDQACGLVFRYQDSKNYYVTRANALEGNVRLYTVKDGRRKQLATWDGKVTGNAWHGLRVEARGDRIEVFWDGSKIISTRDSTFADAGKIGIWTKADSVTSFDDLTIAAGTAP